MRPLRRPGGAGVLVGVRREHGGFNLRYLPLPNALNPFHRIISINVGPVRKIQLVYELHQVSTPMHLTLGGVFGLPAGNIVSNGRYNTLNQLQPFSERQLECQCERFLHRGYSIHGPHLTKIIPILLIVAQCVRSRPK